MTNLGLAIHRVAKGAIEYLLYNIGHVYSRQREWDSRATSVYERLLEANLAAETGISEPFLYRRFEAILAGETGSLGPFLYLRGCLRPFLLARLGKWGFCKVRIGEVRRFGVRRITGG